MTNLVKKRLESFGYEFKDVDIYIMNHIINKVENYIKTSCNISEIPNGLIYVAVDMACGEFLLEKKQIGQLEIGDLDLTCAISSIKEGDVQLNYNGESDADKLDKLLYYLINGGRGELVCYRKILW